MQVTHSLRWTVFLLDQSETGASVRVSLQGRDRNLPFFLSVTRGCFCEELYCTWFQVKDAFCKLPMSIKRWKLTALYLLPVYIYKTWNFYVFFYKVPRAEGRGAGLALPDQNVYCVNKDMDCSVAQRPEWLAHSYLEFKWIGSSLFNIEQGPDSRSCICNACYCCIAIIAQGPLSELMKFCWSRANRDFKIVTFTNLI